MSTQHYTEDLGVEVHMSPSYWDKWTSTPTPPPRDGNAAIAPSNNADSDSNATKRPMSSKKKSLLALSIVALSVGGTFIALGGTTNDNTVKSVDVNKLHKAMQVVSQDDGCKDIRRVLIVPGSEDFQQSSNEESERQRRILNLKGGASARQRRIKCETKKTKKGDNDDKCATKKTKDKPKVRYLAHSSPSTSSSTVSRSSTEPTLCSREETDTTGGKTTDPDPRLPETLPGDITPSPTGARRTPSPTAATATPAPTPRGEEELPRGEDVPETEKLPEMLPLPIYFPTDMPTTSPESGEKPVPPTVTPDPTYSPTEAIPTYAPTSVEATPKPTAKSTNTDPDDSSETGFLGFSLVKNTEYDLMVNAGLTIKRIAKKNQFVQFENGKESTEKWHLWMDGAGIIQLPKGGYAYVSNSEHDDGMGGVYGLYLNDDHEVTGYKKLMGGTTWNCAGGTTPWKTWISCEEHGEGQCWEVDPDPNSKFHKSPTKTELGGAGGQYESVAVDDRDPKNLAFFVTEDKWNGALRRVKTNCSGWGSLHETRKAGCKLETTYLHLDEPVKGEFEWTDSESKGRDSASDFFPNSEGIVFHDGKLSFVSKTKKKMWTLNLDEKTYTVEQTGLKFRGKGSFNGQPDQVNDQKDSNYMYFTEEGSIPGVYARHDKDGTYYTLVETVRGVGRNGDETVGIAVTDEGSHLFFGFQTNGELFMLTRKDGGRF